MNVFFSTLPIWAGAIVIRLLTRDKGGFFHILVNNMEGGELIICATSLFAPLFYFIFISRDERGVARLQFPSSRFFIVTSLIVIILGIIIFAVQRAGGFFGASDRLDKEAITYTSWALSAVALGVVYVAHVYEKFRTGGAAALTVEQTHEFVDQFRRSDK